jgi:aminopeptidase YwaD
MKTRRQLISVLVAVGLILAIVVPTVLAGPGSEDIKALFRGDEVFAQVAALVGFGPRVAGGPAEYAAADYIAAEMASYGLEVEIQEFPMTYFEDLGSTLEVVGGPVLSPNTMSFSPSGEFTAEIVYCGLGYPADFPPEVAGNIALIQRGELYFWEKTQNAAAAGALAAIIFNHSPGNFFGTLTFITDIPAVSISLEEGTMLLDLLDEGPVTVHLDVDTTAYESTSQNVIGTLEGLQPDQGIVYIGGHYDSVSAGPGANDDASGVAGVLEAARVLSTKGHRTKATLKFIAFGSEETGLDGSFNYVLENLEEVSTMGLGMVNLDMIAVGDTLQIGNIDYGLPGTGGNQLRDYAQEKATAMGMPWESFAAGCNSDHCYFEQVGVPVAFLTQRPDPWYHTAEDTLDKIQAATLEANGELATAAMYDWAKNPVLRAKKAAKLEKVHVYHDKVYAGE